MSKKKKARSIRPQKGKKLHTELLVFIGSLFTILLFLLLSYVWYQSRAVAEVGDEVVMTKLPESFQHVLGAKTGPFATQEASLRVPILLYHYVENVHDDPGKQKLNIPPAVLRLQIQTLKQAGYTFITPSDVMEALGKKKTLSKKVIMLSFDDGYMDLYTDVFPLIQEEQVKIVAYVVPNLLNRPNYLFSYQLQELAKSPLVEIGSHTMNHYALAGMNAQTATYEVKESKKTLQDMLHVPVSSFAYPYGSFDEKAVRGVTDAGYTNAVSTIPGITQSEQNKFFFYRLRPGYRSGKTLIDFLNQDSFQAW